MKAWQKRIISISLFALGSESEPPLAPPIAKPGKRILEDLLETEKFQDAQIDAGMQPEAPRRGR